jgi:lysylphosphatidylglycerol synthetase-like protein (DUF2156 family)
MSSTRDWKSILFTVIFAAVVLGFLALAAVRTADVYYKAAWIVTHFPPKNTICSELFCLRTDTSKPERSFGKLHFAYCPDHSSSGFQGRGGRSNAVAVLLAIVVAILAFVSVPIVGGLFRIVAWPILIPMRLAGKLPPGHLLPFKRPAENTPAAGDWLEPAGMIAGALIAVATLVLYCWW